MPGMRHRPKQCGSLSRVDGAHTAGQAHWLKTVARRSIPSGWSTPYRGWALVPLRAPFLALLGALASGALSACDAGKPEVVTQAAPQCAARAEGRAPARLLTRSEYDNSVRDLLGDDTEPAAHSFPPEPEVNGFDNDADSLLANPLLVEKLSETASDVAKRAIARMGETLAPCEEEEPEDACASTFIEGFGKRVFRRPLTSAEKESFLRLFQKAEPAIGYEASISLLLEAMLQSPQFLYRVEAPLVDPAQASAGVVELGRYELASRLSFFFWGSTPDEELLDAADENRLKTDTQIEAQARRLLADDRAKARVTEFHARWLHLGRFETVARTGTDAAIKEAWKRSLLAFVDDVFWSEGGTVRDLFESDRVFLNDTLAPLYGMEDEVTGSAMQPFELERERSGLLTQPGLMAMLAHPDQSSPIARGVFVRERILCNPVPPPPPSVDNSPPDPDPSLTTRERFAVHTEKAECATCHRMIDPIGFGFEEFDQLGRYRAEENGAPVDASGALVSIRGDETLTGEFVGAAEMAERIADSRLAAECLVKSWHQFAMGRGTDKADDCTIQSITQSVLAEGGSLEELLVALAKSQTFRSRPAWAEELP